MLSIPDVGQIDAFAEPWRRLFAQSPLISTLVLFGHLAGLLAAGGLSVASDRATILLDPTIEADRRRHLGELARLRTPVRLALGIAMGCGALLFFADVEAFAGSPIFWTKMLLVALLLANVAIASRFDSSLARGPATGVSPATAARRWQRRRVAAMVSLFLWFVLVLAGSALAAH